MPLVVANYSNNRDNKILYLNKEDTPNAPAAMWYIFPTSSQGYYNIFSFLYIGQSDPNNDFSLFNHVLEAQTTEKVRYGELVNGKGQQQFKISLLTDFVFNRIEYDINEAIVNPYPSHTESYRLVNNTNHSEQKNENVPIRKEDESIYVESASSLLVSLFKDLDNNPVVLSRPTVVGGNKAYYNDKFAKDATYQHTYEKIPSGDYIISLASKPNSYVDLELEYRMFELVIPYTIYASASFTSEIDGKAKTTTIKITGTWTGHSHGDLDIYPPKVKKLRYYDIATGEEIF